MKKRNKLIVVCNGKSCRREGANFLLHYLKENPPSSIEFTTKYCFGKCGNGPIVLLLPDEKFIEGTTITTLKKIIN